MARPSEKLFQWIYLPLVILAVALAVVFLIDVVTPWVMDMENRSLRLAVLIVAVPGSMLAAFYGTAWVAWAIAELISKRK